jgi:hypothetical protein
VSFFLLIKLALIWNPVRIALVLASNQAFSSKVPLLTVTQDASVSDSAAAREVN